MIVSEQKLANYNAIRNTVDKTLLCHAPFTNINFEQNGNMTACCFNRVNVLGKYPENSIRQAWTGKEAEDLREKIRENNLGGGCNWCGMLLNSENYSGTKSIHFDEYAHRRNAIDRLKEKFLGIPFNYYPKVFEFEIDNTCNLECVMCNGYYSSSIRKNQDKLPPLVSPYDKDFVNQIREFIPHLTDMKFLGGEPFLIKIYYDIWDEIIALNPNIGVHITTNGTVLNTRIKDYLLKMKAGIIVSIDTINPQNYPIIRKNGDLSKVLNNIQELAKITRKNQTYLSLAVCPMVNNWRDLPELLQYANDNAFSIHFNVVWKPWELSIRSLDARELKEIVAYLNSYEFIGKSFRERENIKKFQELIKTIEYWQTGDKLHEEEKSRLIQPSAKKQEVKFNIVQKELDKTVVRLSRIALQQFDQKDIENAYLLFDEKEEYDFNLSITAAREAYFALLHDFGEVHFVKVYFDSLYFLCQCFTSEVDLDEYSAKGSILETVILTNPKRRQIIEDMINELSTSRFVEQINFIDSNSGDVIKTHVESNYQ